MNSYTYTARDRTGVRREGMLAANSMNEALEILRTRHLTPIGVRENLARSRKPHKMKRHGRVRSADLGAMCWQLSTMIEGGMTITVALDVIAEDTDNVQLQHILQEARSTVSEGRLLSAGLSKFPGVFNRLTLAILIAGEAGGDLGQTLRTLAEYFDDRDRLAKKIRAAVSYPIFILVLITVIVIGIMGLIVPRFRTIFAQLGGELPAFTRAFMGFYDVLSHNVLYIILLVITVGCGGVLLSKTKRGHRFLSQAMLRLPLFGKLFAEAFIAMFCKTIATLLDAGVPVLEAFEIMRGMSNNDVIASAVAKVKQHVTGGSNVALGMAAAGFFPNMVIKMTQVGEESGSLPAILRKTCEHYERRTTSTIETITALLEPVMIATIGAIVLVVIIAMYLPIFTISDVAH